MLVLIAGGVGWWLLGIAGVWAAMLMGAWIISRWIGGRPHYLESWQFEDGEAVVWRDDRADVYVLTTMARPAVARPLRFHRARVLVTSRRILVAMRELFTGRQRVVYVLYVGAAPKSEDTGDRAVASSFNCAEFRIYTDRHEGFRLPGSAPVSASSSA